MRGLTQFRSFDYERFTKDKVLVVTGISPWTDFATQSPLGTKVEVAIFRDKTEYKSKDGEAISNLYEKFFVKVPKAVSVPLNSVVVAVNPVATIYGDYQNQLSVKADDIQVVQPQTASK